LDPSDFQNSKEQSAEGEIIGEGELGHLANSQSAEEKKIPELEALFQQRSMINWENHCVQLFMYINSL